MGMHMYTSYMILITKSNVRDMDIGTNLATEAKRSNFVFFAPYFLELYKYKNVIKEQYNIL